MKEDSPNSDNYSAMLLYWFVIVFLLCAAVPLNEFNYFINQVIITILNQANHQESQFHFPFFIPQINCMHYFSMNSNIVIQHSFIWQKSIFGHKVIVTVSLEQIRKPVVEDLKINISNHPSLCFVLTKSHGQQLSMQVVISQTGCVFLFLVMNLNQFLNKLLDVVNFPQNIGIITDVGGHITKSFIKILKIWSGINQILFFQVEVTSNVWTLYELVYYQIRIQQFLFCLFEDQFGWFLGLWMHGSVFVFFWLFKESVIKSYLIGHTQYDYDIVFNDIQ